jgi:hypothetical protein
MCLPLSSLYSLDLCNTLAYWAHSSVMKKMKSCEGGPRGCIHTTPFSLQLMIGPKKLVYLSLSSL